MGAGYDNSDITVIICTKNAGEFIEKTILSVLENEPGEIFLVDAHSEDQTREIARKYNISILDDPGKGLALARQIGLRRVKTKYVFYIGDDNVLKQNSLGQCKDYMVSHNWVVCGMRTELLDVIGGGYWAYCSDKRIKLRITEGEKEVVGTPNLYYTEILNKVGGFDSEMAYADDSDIDDRIRKMFPNARMGYSNIFCYEVGKIVYSEIKARFLMYGKSDWQFYNKYSKDWNAKRKIKSILHPFTAEFVEPLKGEKSIKEKFKLIPYLFIITFLRYRGWITYK